MADSQLRSALIEAFVAMRVASSVKAVSDEYDFEPVIEQAKKALRNHCCGDAECFNESSGVACVAMSDRSHQQSDRSENK